MAGVQKTSPMGLPELKERLAGLGSPPLRRLLAKNLAEEARTQVANGFRAERDPYGRPWKAIKYRQGMILQDTGRLRGSVATRATSAGFRIDMPVVYARVHQYGSGRMPQRQMIPMATTGGLGPIWADAFNETARLVLERYGKEGAGA